MKKLVVFFVLLLLGIYIFFKQNVTENVKHTIKSKNIVTDINYTIKKDKDSKKSISNANLKKESPNKKLISKPNLKLNVPKKWQHLDYSILGNPPEVSEDPNSYLAGDEIYGGLDPDNKKTYRDGKTYLDARAEKKFLQIFTDRERLKKLMLDTERAKNIFYTEFNDINNFIKIDEKTGRKKLVDNPNNYFSKFTDSLAKMIGCATQISPIYDEYTYGCGDWKRSANHYIRANKITSSSEKEKVMELYKERHRLFDIDYSLDFRRYAYKHINKSVKKEEFDYFIKNKYEKNPDKYKIYYDQLEVDYYQK